MKAIWGYNKECVKWDTLLMKSKLRKNLKEQGWNYTGYHFEKTVYNEPFGIGFSDCNNGRFINEVRLSPNKQLRKTVAGKPNKRYAPTIKGVKELAIEVEKAIRKSQADKKFVDEFKLYQRLRNKYEW